MRIHRTSTEYVSVPIRVEGAPPGLPVTVRMAVAADSTTDPSGEWQPAEWDGRVARLLVGPEGDVTLPAVSYPAMFGVWVEVAANPERVVMFAGLLEVV